MELQTVTGESGMSTAERIIWGAWGLLSFIFLIGYLRWLGTRDEDQQKPRRSERQSGKQSEERFPDTSP
jgi:hypothetical protein